MLDRSGGLLRELRSSRDGRSSPVSLDALPSHVADAFLAAEDHRFRSHLGVSPTAFVRAARQNFAAGHIVAGGSTITMQLARTLVPRPRTFFGKAQEALWALRLEAHLTKDEILSQYLNRIPFGNNTFGIEAASQLYFGRPARHLSVAQAAALAAIPRGPTAYNPYRRADALRVRQRWVLSRMGRSDVFDEPLDLVAFDSVFRAPHFVEQLDVGAAGEVVTTLDSGLQRRVEEIVREELGALEHKRVSNAAVLVIDNANGEVLAYAGSADFFDAEHEGQNDGVQMLRQPGSALKPFIYAEAFTRGYTPATVIPDLETHFGSVKGTYAPKNYDRKTHGPVRVREALANSFNVPAVRVTDELGPEVALSALRRAGFASLDRGAEHYGLGVALGNGEVTLWEAARAYAGLARGGVLHPLVVVRSPRASLEKPVRFADPRAVALVTDILADNAARARAFGLDNALRLHFPVAAKTGTSKGYSDNWTIGFTRERTVAVWAGNFDAVPMVQVSGITGAGPIFHRVMARAMEGIVPAPLVDETGLVHASICPLSGALAGPQCPSAMSELFKQGTEPRAACPMHRPVVGGLSPAMQKRCGESVTDLGVDYYDWAHHMGLQAEPWLAAACAGADGAAAGDGAAKILSPSSGDEYLLIDDLPLADQAIPVRIRAAPSLGPLEVRLDGDAVATLDAPFTGRVPAKKGAHVLSVLANGEVLASVRYVVRAQ
ncbi:MAG: penicillin-binding protein 1C [Myxococcaceae bacterium]|nr:penicillin-binding protein 1C [Myxococcaceae bacterium]